MPKLRITLPKGFTEFCSEHMLNWPAESVEECKQMLLPCDPNARERSYYKETALHKCIPLEVVKWLVERGADVNLANAYGTPLFKHAAWGHYDICKYLIEHGADVNITAHAERTALISAVFIGRTGNYDTVCLLLAHGADPCHHTAVWDDNRTPLQYLMTGRDISWYKDKPDIAEVLIKAQREQGGIPEEEWKKLQENVSYMGNEFELLKKDWSDEYRNEIETIMNRFYAIFDVTPAKPVLKHDGKSPIEVDRNLSVVEQHSALWEYLVPASGKCSTVQGEVIRITGRVDGEANNNGGANWDAEYRKMLDALEQYFLQGNALGEYDLNEARDAIIEINHFKAAPGCYGCQKQIDYLIELAVKWIWQNPEPIKLGKVAYKR